MDADAAAASSAPLPLSAIPGTARKSKTPSPALRRAGKGVLLGYCLGVRRNHVTWGTVAAPLPMSEV